MKLGLGFIGLGAMGLSHLKAFAQDYSAQCQVAAVCARNEDNIRKALAVAPQVQVFKDESGLLGRHLDAVVISTPNFTHVPLALLALKSGKHVLLEKPCGITREECVALIDASANTDRVVMIGHELRYSAYFQRMRELVALGAIGQPRMVWTREFRGRFQKKSDDWIEDARRSGGTLVDKNCHHFDLMNWWVGARPARVAAFGHCALNRVLPDERQVNDHATVGWEYANGVLGTLQLCMFARDFPDEDLEMGIVGETGTLQTRIPQLEIIQHNRKAVGVNSSACSSAQSEPIIHRVSLDSGGSVPAPQRGWGGHLGFPELHQAFIDAIRTGQKPLTTPRDCIDGTLLAIAAEESIRRGEMVEIAT